MSSDTALTRLSYDLNGCAMTAPKNTKIIEIARATGRASNANPICSVSENKVK